MDSHINFSEVFTTTRLEQDWIESIDIPPINYNIQYHTSNNYFQKIIDIPYRYYRFIVDRDGNVIEIERIKKAEQRKQFICKNCKRTLVLASVTRTKRRTHKCNNRLCAKYNIELTPGKEDELCDYFTC